MKTNTITVGTKATALRKAREKKISKAKLARQKFLFGLSIFANYILVVSLGYAGFVNFGFLAKAISLLAFFGLVLASSNFLYNITKVSAN